MDFVTALNPEGLLLMNSSLIDRSQTRKDIETIKIPATEIADRMKSEVTDLADTRVLQNSVMYGAIIASENETIDKEELSEVLAHVYSGTKSRFIPANLKAVLRGYRFVKALGNVCQLKDLTRI